MIRAVIVLGLLVTAGGRAACQSNDSLQTALRQVVAMEAHHRYPISETIVALIPVEGSLNHDPIVWWGRVPGDSSLYVLATVENRIFRLGGFRDPEVREFAAADSPVCSDYGACARRLALLLDPNGGWLVLFRNSEPGDSLRRRVLGQLASRGGDEINQTTTKDGGITRVELVAYSHGVDRNGTWTVLRYLFEWNEDEILVRWARVGLGQLSVPLSGEDWRALDRGHRAVFRPE
jgi:hypothetical protein